MQYPVGENMPALGVITQLCFVNCDESKFPLDWHTFDGAAVPSRLRWLDPFLAGNQGDLMRAFDRHHAVVNLAGQQAQRKAHHPARMSAHPLHGKMGLAGIGRTKNGR